MCNIILDKECYVFNHNNDIEIGTSHHVSKTPLNLT